MQKVRTGSFPTNSTKVPSAMESSNLIGLPAATLYPAPLRRMLERAALSGVSGVMLTAKGGHLATIHASRLPLVATVTTVGNVAWIRTDACAEAVWLGVMAWGARMDQAKIAFSGLPGVFEKVAASRQFPWVGRHVGDLTAGDIEMAQEYARAAGHTGCEIEVDDATRTMVGAYPVDLSPALDFTDIEVTCVGVTAGVEAFAADIQDALLLRTLYHALASAESPESL
ncbi:MAG: hypothetical protein ACSLE9_05455 [Burkholderiaceae bacterium]